MTTTTTTTYPDVPLPDGARADIWEDGSRTIFGPNRGVEGYDVVVWTAAAPFTDGSIDVKGRVEAPNVNIANNEARGMTSVQARELAAVLIECADEVDGWAGNAAAVNRYPVDSATRTCCGGIGGHTQECAVEGRTDQLRDTHRRMRNILDRFPVSTWDLAEATSVLAALGEIVRGRPESERLPSTVVEAADVIDGWTAK